MAEPVYSPPANAHSHRPGMIQTKRGYTRLPRDERERMIVAEAIRFFAEVGFEGQTRILAERLGVTQPLLYRYFPDKNALIDRVCHEIFEIWQTDWNTILTDRTRRLEDRITGLYRTYVRAGYSHERARLFLFATLRDPVLAARHLAHLRTVLFLPLCREVRHEFGDEGEVPPRDIDLAASLHGAVGYAILCRHTLPNSAWDDLDTAITTLVTTFLGAFRADLSVAAQ
ncbi:TetR/AcrR family transcriptional regulator [Magnetospirillum molischianum]|uniref:Regulatory protein, TetR n=1 Tax=Magnetospirillum molischianum DSM 120 TaxID=1150626 RepID=H8FSI6_MAGML|nr:TetR/AcrR family transcriptional regulator [Magnetospirillum molischianum]CCG41324.1 Regulatory protein, TetR [Magnetospirillum molischianum DSM 120]